MQLNLKVDVTNIFEALEQLDGPPLAGADRRRCPPTASDRPLNTGRGLAFVEEWLAVPNVWVPVSTEAHADVDPPGPLWPPWPTDVLA